MNSMDWDSIDWNKLRNEIMREEETKMNDVKVTVCPHEHETNTYKVVYEVGERSDYIPTGMHTILSAIGYAVCYLENEIHEQDISDHMPNYYRFTTHELYTVLYKLNGMQMEAGQMTNNYFEAVEMCAYCESENIYPMWDVNVNGYVATCKHCGQQIMLCDECQHAADNPNRNCDWCATKCGGKCFRGSTINE